VDMADVGFVEDGDGRRFIDSGAVVHRLSLLSPQREGEAA
jgi:hypothetical protein